MNKYTKKFIRHNQKIFDNTKATQGNSIFLCEFNNMQSSHIAYSYLTNLYKKNMGANIYAYSLTIHTSKLRSALTNILFRLKEIFSFDVFAVYKSFGTKKFLRIKLKKNRQKEAYRISRNIYKQVKSKKDVENLIIEGIYLGDIIYDSYLRKFEKPTIDIRSISFQESLYQNIIALLYWVDFFESNKVCGISVSHCVYENAIPLRVAISKDIPSYQIGLTHFYKLNKERMFAYTDFHDYPETFQTLSLSSRIKAKKEAKKRIEMRFSGKVGIDMSYSQKSAFGNVFEKPLLKKNNKIKILVAAHCFFDSPHSFGNNLFTDFYEWLSCLSKISYQTDYDWYIKTHPDFIPQTRTIIENFVQKHEKFNLLPAESSHHQIIEEGINFALTTYGTIGFEYAALNIPVINASVQNPHIAYNFNINPKNVDEYVSLLTNLHHVEHNIEIDEVYEYYYMRNIFFNENIFFENYKNILSKIGGYKKSFSPLIYQAWMKELNFEKNKMLNKKLLKFVNSQSFRYQG